MPGVLSQSDPESIMSNKIYTVDEIREIVIPIARRHGVAALYLFGSYARGEATAKSDIDFLMDGGTICSLYQLAAFRLDLEDALGKTVDLLTLGHNDQMFIHKIRKDEVKIYAAA